MPRPRSVLDQKFWIACSQSRVMGYRCGGGDGVGVSRIDPNSTDAHKPPLNLVMNRGIVSISRRSRCTEFC